MSKKCIFLNTSDIASFIGQNKWNYIESFERLWKKYDPEYIVCLNELNSKNENDKINLILAKNKENSINQDLLNNIITKKEYNKLIKENKREMDIVTESIINITSKISDISLTQTEKINNKLGDEITNTISSSTTETSDKRKITINAIDKLAIRPEEKVELLKQTESLINKTYGILKEDSAIFLFEERFNIKLDTSQVYLKTLINSTSVHEIYIGGRLDGICYKDGYIVEVKNRIKGFFNEVRDYELTQIQLYLLLSKLNKAKLVEKYKLKIKVTDINLNKEYINDTVEYLGIFIKYFEIFLNDYKKKMEFIKMNETDKQKFICKLYLNEINEKRQYKIDKKYVEDKSDTNCLIDDLDDF